MSYDYLFQEGPDHYVDQIESNGGTIFFRCQGDTGRAVNYAGLTNNYRVIHSTLIFGALQERTNTRNELMARYMNYLTGLTSLENETTKDGLINSYNNIVNYPNPFVAETKIFFSPPKQNNLILQIYDIKGSLIISRPLSITSNCFIWDGKDNLGNEVKSGTYLVRLKTGTTSITKLIVKAK